MNKKKLSIGLVSSLIAVLALAACNEVTTKEKAIVTFKDSAGKEVTVLTNDIYDKYRESSDGISKFYNAILESIIRHEFDSSSTTIYKKSKEKILSEAKGNVTGAQQEAEQNRKTNGTTYDEEWQKILDSHGCEDADELLEYFKYEIEKEEIEDKYFVDNKETLTKEYIGVDDQGEAVQTQGSIKSSYPFHVRHVLVKVAEGASSFYDGTISEGEAKNLSESIKYLTDTSFVFSEVATKISEDTGSAEKGGDLGIMTTTTSFVNEFKLGIYAYEAISEASNSAIEEGLGLNAEVSDAITAKDFFTNLGLQEVPYGAFLKIGEVAEDVADKQGREVNGNNSHYYPRNVLWNKYLNFHNPFVITNEVLDEDNIGDAINFPLVVDDETLLNPRFKLIDASTGKSVLTDENGNVIIGVRSEHGIHFMILQKSIYDFCEGGKDSYDVSLEEYYTNTVPGDEKYPVDPDGKDKNTYVNYIYSTDKSVYETRASEIKSAIKSFDSTYDYRLYEKYSVGLRFNNTDGIDLGKKITEYITATRYTNSNSAKETLNKAWRTYAELIELQNANRVEYVDATTDYRLIPTRCVIGFKMTETERIIAGINNDWVVPGGACYYVK